MWFIGGEVEQETSASPLLKKSWIRPCVTTIPSSAAGQSGNYKQMVNVLVHVNLPNKLIPN